MIAPGPANGIGANRGAAYANCLQPIVYRSRVQSSSVPHALDLNCGGVVAAPA